MPSEAAAIVRGTRGRPRPLVKEVEKMRPRPKITTPGASRRSAVAASAYARPKTSGISRSATTTAASAKTKITKIAWRMLRAVSSAASSRESWPTRA